MRSQACVRVLQINSVCGKGSTGKLAVQISDVLTENGVEEMGDHKTLIDKGGIYAGLYAMYTSDR